MKTNNLHYFQFDPSVFCNADISCLSLTEQGLFIQICSMYWNRGCCSIAKELLKQKLGNENLIDNLIEQKILKIEKNGDVFVNFLKEQYVELNAKYLKRSQAGRFGGLAKAQKSLSNATAMPEQCQSNAVAIPPILDKIRLDNIKKNKKEKKSINYDEAKKLYDIELENSPTKSPYRKFVNELFGDNELNIKYSKTLEIPGILTKKNYSILNEKHNRNHGDYLEFNKQILKLLQAYENNPKYWGKQNVYLMLNNWLSNDYNK